MGDKYDVNKPTVIDAYWDKNNLYGEAMAEPLPYAEYKCVEDKDLSDVDAIAQEMLDTSNDARVGYFLEVDLEYPVELHDKHNDLPFCPEHICIGDLIKNSNHPLDHMRINSSSKDKKLVLTLYDKKNYLIHYRMLKLVLRHGLKLRKVHKMLSFKQSRWVKPYVDENTEQRKKATTAFGKDIFKLNLNASYGKPIENLFNRCDIRLITQWDGRYGLESQIAKPNFKRNVIFNENLVACEMSKTSVCMNKPTIVGIAILEISKCLMYEFHYDFVLQHFNETNCKILYTDTDSFLYEFKSETNKDIDPYAFIRQNSAKFDTSDFAENNQFGIKKLNQKVIGLMKDELKGELIAEFIGLRSKMYTIRTFKDNNVIKRAKGVKQNVLDKKVSFDDYKRCMNELYDEMKEKQSCMRSVKHTVYNITNEKKVLDPYDDKRYLILGTNSTWAWGHGGIRIYDKITIIKKLISLESKK